MKDKIRETLAFEDLTPEDKEKRHILGRLYGPIADVVNPTRNGRRYSEELWENVFKNPIMKEKFNNKVMYGELGHPEDRTEIDMSKVAVCMPEAPKKDKEGHLIGYFDILDTPNGRILKTLCDYGSTLGISSRGTGDLYTDDDGEEAVDPETYDCECFDIVLIPAVESARLAFTEGLEKNHKTMKQALCESLEKASDEDRKVMEEALETLNINVKDETVSNPVMEENIEESDTQEQPEKAVEATNDGSEAIIRSLQETIRSKSELEERVKILQEQLAVSDAKVGKLEESLEKNKSTIIRLTSLAKNSKDLTKKVSDLEEELKVKNQTIEKLNKESSRVRLENKESARNSRIDESIKIKDSKIKELNESVDSLKKENVEIKHLNESLKQELTNSNKQVEELKGKVTKLNSIKEGYKKLSNDTVDKYIELKAKNLGVSANEIKNKLDSSYTLEDIDKICESIQAYELNISKLPFNVDRKVKVRVSESGTLKPSQPIIDDDYVDEDTMLTAGLL